MISFFDMQHQLITIVSKNMYSLTPSDWLFMEIFCDLESEPFLAKYKIATNNDLVQHVLSVVNCVCPARFPSCLVPRNHAEFYIRL